MPTEFEAVLAKHLERALRGYYGIKGLEDDDFGEIGDIRSDHHFEPGTRFYCPHCGGGGTKKDKVRHDKDCWYHAARQTLYAYKRENQHAG